MRNKADLYLGYYGPEWNKKTRDKDNPNFWKYGVANLVFLDLVKHKRKVLDVGCGTGGSTIFLAEHAQPEYIVGVDPVESMIKVAKHKASQRNLDQKTDFILCDGRNLPFQRLCFDALVSRGDAFVFLVPQESALHDFKRVLKNDAVVIIEIDNVRWKPGKVLSYCIEKTADGAVAYSVEYFDAKRNHFKIFYILNPNSRMVEKISVNDEFIKTGRLKRRFPLKEIRRETVETRRGTVTHWPTVNEVKMLFKKVGFRKIEVFGDGLLMGLLLEGDQKVVKVIQKQPKLFFEIEKKLIPFIDPKKAHTIILRAVVP